MKVGDMVKAAYIVDGHAGARLLFHTGVIISIDKETGLFSEKFAITETNTYVRVLSNGSIMTFDPVDDRIEVLNEGS